jgi:prepilin-type N-terminal cleavage/methylation domain-containing protein
MRRKGFTLIELIIVIVIIGILASISAPMIQGMKTKAICAEAVTAMGTIRTVLRAYYMEYNGFPATSNFANWLIYPPPGGINLPAAGFPPDNLTGAYFSKYCYYIYLNPGNPAEPESLIWVTPHPEFFGNSPNNAPRKNETNNIDDTPPGILGMRYKTGRITQSGISRSGYPSE